MDVFEPVKTSILTDIYANNFPEANRQALLLIDEKAKKLRIDRNKIFRGLFEYQGHTET